MPVAKGILRVKKSELEKLFNLPEDIEIFSIEGNGDDTWTIHIVSPYPVTVDNYTVTTYKTEGSMLRQIFLNMLKRKNKNNWFDVNG